MEKGFFKKQKKVDSIYELINETRSNASVTDISLRNAQIIRLVESGCTSEGGLQRALEIKDIELATYLWENNHTVRSRNLKNICYCMETLIWAHERNIPFDESSIHLVTNIWNAHEVDDRLLFLFKECKLRVTNNDTWNGVNCRNVAYLGFRYCAPCVELRNLVERTCDIGAMHVCCIENKLDLRFEKCVGGLTSYDELVILCQYTNVYIRDVIITVMMSPDIEENVLVDIIREIFKFEAPKHYYNLFIQQDMFDWFVENGRYKAAKKLGHLAISQGKNPQFNWKKWIIRKISEMFGTFYLSHDDGLQDIYSKDIRYHVRYGLMDQREGDSLKLWIQNISDGLLMEFNFERIRDEHCRISEQRRLRLFCLCAHRFDKQSAFSRLPSDLFRWIMKNYI